jgi:UDP-glucuronate 4-epimerase
LEPLVAGTDGVFHLAAQPGVRGSWGQTFAVYVRDNILATQRLFETAARLGVRVTFASSSSVYGDAERHPTSEDVRPRPISPYGVTKLGCEHLAGAYGRGFGLDVVALRYFTVYGPRQRPDMAFTRITTALHQGRAFRVFGSGEQSRDFTYVADAVSATLAAMDRAPAGAVYNVGGGTEASLCDVIALCEQISGRRLELVREEAMAGDVRRTAADTSTIRAELGWAPRTGLEEGLSAHLEWAARTVDVMA